MKRMNLMDMDFAWVKAIPSHTTERLKTVEEDAIAARASEIIFYSVDVALNDPHFDEIITLVSAHGWQLHSVVCGQRYKALFQRH